MIRRSVCLGMELILVCVFSAFATITFYVSPEGSDDAGGSENAPFRTLHKARDAVREVNGGTEDIEVILRGNAGGGYHFLDSTLTFDERDGGRNGQRVIFRNYPGEAPVISGGIRVGNWEVHDAGKNIWKAEVVRDKKIRNMTVNYTPAIRAIGPRFEMGALWGSSDLGGSEGFYVEKEVDIRWGSEIGPVDLQFDNPRDVEIYRWDSWMAQQWCVEDLVEPGTHAKVKMQQPMWRIAEYKAGGPKEGVNVFTFENAYDFMDVENEFYFDRPANTLYYIPRQDIGNMNEAVVIVPRVECLVRIQGESPSARVKNIEFQGISFHDDDYQLLKVGDSRGYVCVQSITAFARPVAYENGEDHPVTYWMGHLQIQSAVEVLFAENIKIESCRFEYLGGGGVNFMNDVHNSVVNGSVFRWVGAQAVNVGHDEHCNPEESYPQELYPFPPEAEYWETCSNIVVSNNVTRGTAWQFTHAPIMTCYFAKDCKWLHNDIGPCAYDAFSIGWGWGRCNETDEHAGNEASFNIMRGATQYHGDGAAFYTLGDQQGLICEGNYFTSQAGEKLLGDHDLVHDRWGQQKSLFATGMKCYFGGYYPDQQSINITYKNTVFETCGGSAFNLWTGGPKLSVDGFYYVKSDGIDAMKEKIESVSNVEQYSYEEGGSRPAHVQAIVDAAGPEPAYEQLYGALNWIPGEPSVTNTEPRPRAQKTDAVRIAAAPMLRAGSQLHLSLTLSHRSRVVVDLIDSRGRMIARLTDGVLEEGSHTFPVAEQSVQRGYYLAVIRSQTATKTVPMLHLD